MINLKTIHLLVLFFLLSFLHSFAQKPPIKFGKATLEELKMTHYKLDSSASAVVLCDYGYSYIDYGTDQFQIHHVKTTRIKIFNKDGYDYANHSFRLYKDNGREEEYSQLKGITYNLESGKIVKTKLEKPSVFREKVDENHLKVKFTMPAVKEGSVIEYTYKTTSDFIFNYQGWQFQYDIPVAWSEYRAKFIEYYNYQADFQGYLSPFINDVNRGTQNFSIKVDSHFDATSQGGQKVPFRVENYTANFTEQRIVIKDVPAFIEEPNITTVNDYLSMINYELQTIAWPNQPIKRFRGTWVSLNQEMLESDYLGKKTRGALFLNKVVEENTSPDDNENQKVRKLHAYISKNMTWNGVNSKYVTRSLKESFEKKKGSSADINIMLINALNKAGIIAEPVLVSTRKNGLVKEFNAVSSQFNYIICKAWVGDKFFLLDATEKFLSPGALPIRCLNGNGYTISKDRPGWVSLTANDLGAKIKVSGSVILEPDGNLKGELIVASDGYRALTKRKSFYYKGEDDFEKDIIEESTFEVDSLAISNTLDVSNSFNEFFAFHKPSGSEVLGNKIYFNPVIINRLEKNIYKVEERTYPANYACSISEDYYVTFEIPEGYTLEETPEMLNLVMPNRDAFFTYKVIPQGNKFTVFTRLRVKKTLYLPEEYPTLKAFYGQMVSKLNEQVVLKKT